MKHPDSYALPAIDEYLKLSCGQFDVIGRSIAGVETVFAIPQFNLVFDTGRAPSFAIGQDHLALTHLHPDHAGGLVNYLGLRGLNGRSPAKIIVPPAKLAETASYLKSIRDAHDASLACELLSANEPILLKKNLVLKHVPTRHSTPSNGYVVWQTHKKLKEQFKGWPEGEIIAAKSGGAEISDEETRPVLAFSGDSTGHFLSSEAAFAEVLLMECTFFEENLSAQSESYGHTNILDWREHAAHIQSRIVVMTHTSQRYSLAEIEASCRKHLPDDLLERLVIFRRS